MPKNSKNVIAKNVATEGLSYPYSQGSKDKGNSQLPQSSDALTNEKALVAAVFREYWFMAKAHPEYLKQKGDFLAIN